VSAKAQAMQIRGFHELVKKGQISDTATLAAMSLSAKIDAWYGDYSRVESREALLEQAEKLFTARITKMEGALERLEEKRTAFLHKEQWKHQGDLILSNAHLLSGTSDFLECPDYETGGTLRIQIDPKKSAPENARAPNMQIFAPRWFPISLAMSVASTETTVRSSRNSMFLTMLELTTNRAPHRAFGMNLSNDGVFIATNISISLTNGLDILDSDIFRLQLAVPPLISLP
jgi:hypothetical protein